VSKLVILKVRDGIPIDASEEVLGKLSHARRYLLMGQTQTAILAELRNVGDFVVVTKCRQNFRLRAIKTGQKTLPQSFRLSARVKNRHFGKMMTTFPERVIEHAVKGMLPKNHLNA